MQEILATNYHWLKAGHIVFVIFWMAGLFMLPRFFVYHQECAPGSAEEVVWLEREGKLLKIILNPSITLVWVLGMALAYATGALWQGWFIAKLILVLALSAYHFTLSAYHRKLARGTRSLTGRQLRLFNEVPGVAAVLIVILVVVRPF